MLLEQKQKDEAYWEEYIQVKEEFVDQVLQVSIFAHWERKCDLFSLVQAQA